MSNQSAGGIGAPAIAALLFIALKLTDHIDWSWWWVLSPLWIPAALLLIVAAAIVVIEIHDSLRPSRKNKWIRRG